MALFHDLWGDKGRSVVRLARDMAKPQSTRQVLVDRPVSKEEKREALKDYNVARDHLSSSNVSSPSEFLFREMASFDDNSSLGSLVCEDSSSNSCDKAGLPSHGWDLETYESFLPGTFIHIEFSHVKELIVEEQPEEGEVGPKSSPT